jgi:hypothetical protein
MGRFDALYAGSAACRVPGYRPASTAELGEAGPYLAYGFFHQKEARGSPLSLLLSEISLPAEQAATYKGTGLPRSPRTDPYRQLSRIRLLPWVADGEALAWPRVEDSGFGEPVGGELLYPLPC